MMDESDEPLHPMCVLILIVLSIFQMMFMADTGRTFDIFGNVYVNGEYSFVETMMYGLN